ncbi:cell wall hydrolase [Sphingomonas ginkgonis]|uniref:cell wall hydrolase n=1 Tax=Sphingomonas ginkgonis TaxID=2315330 RepID=UPI0016395E3E|nr:cell wall hydrolase [Sphingomonas ginkgonis]
MTRLLGSRGAAALGALMLTTVGGSSGAYAQVQTIAQVPAGPVLPTTALPGSLANPIAGSVVTQSSATMVRSAVLPVAPAPAVTVVMPQPTAAFQQPGFTGAPAGQPGSLYNLMVANWSNTPLDAETQCLATAVYFEARGESLEGQLAVANVVINRAASGRYPTSWCAVVKQPAQFSFVHSGGEFPYVDPGCTAYMKAQAIARIASKRLAAMVPQDVLWYHASYVAPNWRQRLSRVEKIGAHIFYRA